MARTTGSMFPSFWATSLRWPTRNSATVLEDGSVTIDVVANDTDAEDGAPDPATVEIVAADDATAARLRPWRARASGA